MCRPALAGFNSKETSILMRTLIVSSLCLALAGAGGFYANRALVYAAPRETTLKELPSYRDVVKRVLPAVVSIEAKPKNRLAGAKQPAPTMPPFGNMPGLPDELRKELERFRVQPPDALPHRAFGSGFIVDPTGIILTNDHVVRGAEEVEVHLQDGRKFSARDIKKDPKTDLAVLRVETKESLPFLKLGDSDAVEIGDRVLAVGAPLGLTGTVTSGIISAKGRDIHMNLYEDFLQTDAAINPGNSGGPLVNLDGEVIGINSAIKSGTGGFQGIGLAISSNLTKTVMEQLQKNGAVHRGYLGVQVQALDPEVATKLGMDGKSGVVIAKVTAGAPAAKSGMKDGDVLAEIAGQAVKDPKGLQRIVAGLPTGKEVELTVFRDGARKSLKLTVEEQPESFGTVADSSDSGLTNLGKIGVKVMDMTAEQAKKFGYSEKTEGVLIAEVDPDGIAGGAGLRSGMLVLKVDGQPVKTAQEAQKAMGKGSLEKGVLFQVRTPQGGTTYVLLKAPAAR
jgi:serine protease Do